MVKRKQHVPVTAEALAAADEKMLSKCPETPRPVSDFYFAVISSSRPGNVPGMQALLKDCSSLVWYVGSCQAEAYKKAGAVSVVEGGGLCNSRNMALEAAFAVGKVCVQISDDVHRLRYIDSPADQNWVKPKSISVANAIAKAADTIDVSFVAAARFVESCCRLTGAHLGGIYPCPNDGQACGGKPIMTEHFVVGDFFVSSNSSPRFDLDMTLKEDYDYTVQHLHTYGKVARVNRLIIYADHYDNHGGAVACRNKSREAKNIRLLRQKWPGVFMNSPRGPSEVRMRWDKRDVTLGGTRIFEPDPKLKGRCIADQSVAKRIREERLQREDEAKKLLKTSQATAPIAGGNVSVEATSCLSTIGDVAGVAATSNPESTSDDNDVLQIALDDSPPTDSKRHATDIVTMAPGVPSPVDDIVMTVAPELTVTTNTQPDATATTL